MQADAVRTSRLALRSACSAFASNAAASWASPGYSAMPIERDTGIV